MPYWYIGVGQIYFFSICMTLLLPVNKISNGAPASLVPAGMVTNLSDHSTVAYNARHAAVPELALYLLNMVSV